MKSWDSLTKREWEVVRLIADGHNNESISNQLAISSETIKRHKINISRKIGVNSSLEICVAYYKQRAFSLFSEFDLQSN